MTSHATHSMHRHSLAANRTVDRATIEARILAVYQDAPLTDQEVAERVGVPAWRCRPRISDLVSGKKRPPRLIEVGSVRELISTDGPPRYRTVRLTQLVTCNPPQEPQP
jgi:hypothetical protein